MQGEGFTLPLTGRHRIACQEITSRDGSAQPQASKRHQQYQKTPLTQSLFMTTDDSREEESGTGESRTAEDTPENQDPDASEKGVTKTVLLTIPLFMKFVAVLLIKFVTDVIVFPILLFYRVAHNGKRKLLQLFRKKNMSNPNGEASSE
jgi:hypothetical protein